MEEMGIGLDEYQELYEEEGITLLEERGELTGDHDPVTITFSLAFKKVSERNAAAADLLKVCAFLAPDAIPKEIFVEGRDALGDTLAADAKSAAALTQIIATASKFSLVYRNVDAKTLDMHRLVQEVLREEMDEAERKDLANRAMEAVNSTFSDAEFRNWETCDRLLSHTTTVLGWQKQYQLESESTARLLNETGFYVKARGRYSEAEPLLQQALAIRQRLLGEEHPDVAQSLNNLANLYSDQGRYSEAEPLYQQALEMDKRLLGEEHPDVAMSLNNLALLYSDQGRYSEAEPLLQQALAIRQRLLGEEHPDVAQSLISLGYLYYYQGRYSKSESYYQESLAMDKRLLGDTHPYVGRSLDNLAMVYVAQDDIMQARLIFTEALAILENALGAEHPWSVQCRENLAKVADSDC